MADVFISYHVASGAGIVRQIDEELGKQGISCWFSEENVAPGEYFAEKVPQEIDACRVFLLMLDEDASKSFHVQNEVHLAVQRRAKGGAIDLIPFYLLDKPLIGPLRYDLAQFQRVDGQSQPLEKAIQEAVERIYEIVYREEWQEIKRLREEIEKEREASRKAQEETEQLREELRKEQEETKREQEKLRKVQTDVENLREELHEARKKQSNDEKYAETFFSARAETEELREQLCDKEISLQIEANWNLAWHMKAVQLEKILQKAQKRVRLLQEQIDRQSNKSENKLKVAKNVAIVATLVLSGIESILLRRFVIISSAQLNPIFHVIAVVITLLLIVVLFVIHILSQNLKTIQRRPKSAFEDLSSYHFLHEMEDRERAERAKRDKTTVQSEIHNQ